MFAFSEHGTVSLCSYIPKKKKNVLLISTMHKDNSVSGLMTKLEIIQYYNKTKGGVDNMDKMLQHFYTKRQTLRWPLAVFYNMIDVACLATYITVVIKKFKHYFKKINSYFKKFKHYFKKINPYFKKIMLK